MKAILASLLLVISVVSWATEISDLLSLSRAEATEARPVEVTGVVTAVFDWLAYSGVLADETDPNGPAVYFATSGVKIERPRVGDRVRLVGVTAPMAYAPGIVVRAAETLGRVDLPPAPVVDDATFLRLSKEGRRLAVRGVLTSVRNYTFQDWEKATNCVSLTLGTLTGRVAVRAPGCVSDYASLVDGEVEIRGVPAVLSNARAEYLETRLVVGDRADIVLRRPPPTDPFAMSPLPFEEILAYRPQEDLPHAVHVRGRVTAHADETSFFLQDGSRGLRVRTREARLPLIGEALDVVGFPRLEGPFGILCDSVFRLASDPLPVVVAREGTGRDLFVFRWVDGENRFADNDGIVVRLPARFTRWLTDGFEVRAKDLTLRVISRDADLSFLADAAETQPLLDLTGVLELEVEPAATASILPQPKRCRLHVTKGGDIRIVPDGAYRTRRLGLGIRRALWLVAGTLLLAILALGVRLLKVGRARGRLAAVAEERKRMAADLHDTIEQYLAGARILMANVGREVERNPAAARKAADLAVEVLLQAKGDVRKTIMDLRNDEAMSAPLAEQLRRLAADVSRMGLLKVRTALRGLPEALAGHVKVDILSIVREALTNAAKHGGAKTAVLASDPTDGGFVLSVANDGARFDPASAPGPEEGHFGLTGMEERAARIAANLTFEPNGKWMCVRLEVKV